MNDHLKPEVITVQSAGDFYDRALPKMLAYRPEPGTLIVAETTGQPVASMTAPMIVGMGDDSVKDLAARFAVFTERMAFSLLVVGDVPGVTEGEYLPALTKVLAVLDALGVQWLAQEFIGIERADEVFGHLPTREEWLATTSEEDILANHKRAEVEALRRIAELSDPS